MRVLIFFFFGLIGVSCWGFKSGLHGEITSDAFDVLKNCGLDQGLQLQKQDVSRGSIEEDTTESEVRLRNWHFFNTYGNLGQGPLIHESLDYVFSFRNHQAAQAKASLPLNHPEVGYRLGRVLHYIQDVFVPAHVVPVFHGGPNGRTDEFDHYVLDPQIKKEILKSIDCSSLASENGDRHQVNQALLVQSAQSTLQKIRSPIGKSQLPWSYFWQEPASKEFDFFDTPSVFVALGVQAGRFGKYVGQFGIDTEAIALDGSKVSIRREDYQEFYADRYQQAVQASAKFILLNR